MAIGTIYPCEEGGYAPLGVAACFTVNAAAIASCVIQCGAAAWDCYAYFMGAGDPGNCYNGGMGCYECIEALELDDCGCIPHTCIRADSPSGEDYDDADIIYGGDCD